MASKVLNTTLMIIGGLVLALLAFIAVYVIGYSLVATFTAGGMGGGTARGVGAGIALAAAIIVVGYMFGRGLSGLGAWLSGHTEGGLLNGSVQLTFLP